MKFLKLLLVLVVFQVQAQQGGMWIPSLLKGTNEKEMKAFYSAILIFEETPNASPISAIKNSTDVPP